MDIIDLNFTGKETTQERLIKATQALIALYGYDAMTTRMIANTAKVTLSAINFHFGSKEELTKAAVMKAAEDLQKIYSEKACEIRHFLKQKPVDKEQRGAISTGSCMRASGRRSTISAAGSTSALPSMKTACRKARAASWPPWPCRRTNPCWRS